MLSGQQDAAQQSRNDELVNAEDDEDEHEHGPVSRGRPRRAAQQNRVKAKPLAREHAEEYNSLGSMDDESDATSSGNEWNGGDGDEPDDHIDDDDDEEDDEDVDMSENSVAEEDDDDLPQTLVVSLRYKRSRPFSPSQDTQNGSTISKDHSILPMTSDNPKEPPESAYLQDAPKSTQDAAPNQYSRSGHQSGLLSPAVQYNAPTDPRPQVGRPGQSPPNAEHLAPTAPWPRPGTGVVAPNGTKM